MQDLCQFWSFHGKSAPVNSEEARAVQSPELETKQENKVRKKFPLFPRIFLPGRSLHNWAGGSLDTLYIAVYILFSRPIVGKTACQKKGREGEKDFWMIFTVFPSLCHEVMVYYAEARENGIQFWRKIATMTQIQTSSPRVVKENQASSKRTNLSGG